MNRFVEFVRGDITEQDTDVIVNAANERLTPGGGVSGAIHRAAGCALADECALFVQKRGPLEAGEIVLTGAGRLRAKHIIHAVGPRFIDGLRGEPAALASCYREALHVADDIHLSSIAFPSISTGIFGYPLGAAADIAVTVALTAAPWMRHISLIRFVLFDARTLNAYEQALRLQGD